MDQFGVLVENYGIKQQGKSAPMAAVKSGIKAHDSKPTNSWKSIVDDHDDPFQFKSGVGFQKQNNGGFGDLDFGFPPPPAIGKFGNGASSGGGGGGLDFVVESVFRDSMNLGPKPSNSNVGDDLFSGFSGKNTFVVDNDDLLSSTPVDDFFGNIGEIGSVSNGSVSQMGSESKKNKFDQDELIPGFGPKPTSTNHGTNKYPKIAKPPKQVPQAASFIDIESSSDSGGQYGKKEDGVNEWNFQAAASADAEVDLDSFFTAPSGTSGANISAETPEVDIDSFFSVPTPNTTRVSENPIPVQTTKVDVDSLFGVPNVPAPNTSRVSGKPIPVQVDVDSLFGFPNVKTSAEVKRTKPKNEATPDLFSGTSSHSRNNLSSSSAVHDFDFFGGSMASGAFEEIEGEDDERRRARHERFLRTEARMAQALAEMNSREFQAQQEQQERHRIAEIKDSEMKLWAAGKEGNLRALLSSLHQVLWPECGWKALSLADLITSSQVKVAYKRAALCVHPDKVQQKGATTQQKYVAEKVFDLLKEASNKFSQEELR